MIRHVSSIAEIVDDMDAAVGFYRDVLGLPVKYEAGAEYARSRSAGSCTSRCGGGAPRPRRRSETPARRTAYPLASRWGSR